MTKTEAGLELGMYTGFYSQGYDKTEKVESVTMDRNTCILEVYVESDTMCRFYCSLDGETFHPIGKEFKASAGTWIGAKVGLFHINPNITDSTGYADFEWFRF